MAGRKALRLEGVGVFGMASGADAHKERRGVM